jgi:hypothetical protein
MQNSAAAGYAEINVINSGGGVTDRVYMGVGGTSVSADYIDTGYIVADAGISGGLRLEALASGAKILLGPVGNLVEQRNGTNAQNFRLYNTYTNSSNYERLVFDWTSNSNVLMLRTEAAGSGTRRDMWMQWGGQARVSSDVNSNNTTSLALATFLSVQLLAGRTYSFEAFLSFTCTPAQGIRAAMVASGGLTATDIRYDGWIVDSAANGIKGNAQASALSGVVANAAITGTAGHVLIRGTITVNVAGDLQVHFAQSVAAANNTTVKRGSFMIVYDMT